MKRRRSAKVSSDFVRMMPSEMDKGGAMRIVCQKYDGSGGVMSGAELGDGIVAAESDGGSGGENGSMLRDRDSQR